MLDNLLDVQDGLARLILHIAPGRIANDAGDVQKSMRRRVDTHSVRKRGLTATESRNTEGRIFGDLDVSLFHRTLPFRLPVRRLDRLCGLRIRRISRRESSIQNRFAMPQGVTSQGR